MKLVPGGPAQVGTDPSDDLRNFGDRPAATVQLRAFCIDTFEYPNRSGEAPRLSATWTEADSICRNAGKRLCSEDEWEKACKGPANLRFPYGGEFDADACNTQDRNTKARKVSPVGAYGRCKSGYGVYDQSGNAAEWTASAFEAGGEKAVKGGSASRPGFDDRCSSRRRLAPGSRDGNVGFRCCSDAR
jgi:formylglycine-generating enzyme required for sulfatase activity